MASSQKAAKAYLILEAVQLTVNVAISQLQQLVASHPEAFPFELVLRILLTYLPEVTEPETYTDFLSHLKDGTLPVSAEHNQKGPKIRNEISEFEARQRVRQLRLLPIANPQHLCDSTLDTFTRFLLHRASRIESETGSIPLVSQLVKPFIEHSEYLQTWAISTLLPLLRLHYDYYTEESPVNSLDELEKLSGGPAVQSLLSRAICQPGEGLNANIGRDIRGVVGPWMYGQNSRKRRKLDRRQRRQSSVYGHTSEHDAEANQAAGSEGWEEVNEWLLNLATRNYTQAVAAFEQWDGPRDVDYGGWDRTEQGKAQHDVAKILTNRYAQAGFSAIYATASSDLDTIKGSHRILERVAKLLELPIPPDIQTSYHHSLSNLPQDYIKSLSQSHLFHNALLRSHNPLTSPSHHALSLANSLLCSGYILNFHGCPRACRNLLSLAIFESETEQLAELRILLHTIQGRIQDENSWEKIRHQMLWLQQWNSKPPEESKAAATSNLGLFCKIPSETIEIELLKAMLGKSCEC